MNRHLARLGALLTGALLVYATLGWATDRHPQSSIDVLPFADYARITLSMLRGQTRLAWAVFYLAVNLVGNVVVFAPFGFFLYLSLSRNQRLRWTALLGVAFSLALELGQLAIAGRTTAVDDVVLNSLGTTLGGGLAALCLRRQKAKHLGRQPS